MAFSDFPNIVVCELRLISAAMHDLIGHVFSVGSPSEMIGVYASKMALPARVRGVHPLSVATGEQIEDDSCSLLRRPIEPYNSATKPVLPERPMRARGNVVGFGNQPTDERHRFTWLTSGLSVRFRRYIAGGVVGGAESFRSNNSSAMRYGANHVRSPALSSVHANGFSLTCKPKGVI
jgi:hypothetical protein